MEFGGGYFQGRVAADSHGTAPTICEVADEREAQRVSRFFTSSTNHAFRRARPDEKVASLEAAVQALGPHAGVRRGHGKASDTSYICGRGVEGWARLESLRAEAAVPMPQPQVPHQNLEADVSRSKSSTSGNGS